MRSCRSHRIAFAALLGSLLASSGCAPKPHDYRDKNFDYFVVGDPTLPRAAHTEFSLSLMGGGGMVDSAYAAIARHAGGGHIVILRAVADDSFDPDDGDYGKLFAGRWGPVSSAETIVFHNRDASYDSRIIAALHAADGIFLAGGDQGNYIRYWKGTPIQAALDAHVLANRPIGGSSAGLAILGRYSYTAFDGGSMESQIALKDPYDSGMTLEDGFLHLRFLERVITDTHFSKRSRLGRLIVFVARLETEHPDVKVLGIGLDEKSALLVGPDGVGRVAAGSAGNAWLIMPRHAPETLIAGKPLTMKDIRIVRLDEHGSVDLQTEEVARPAQETVDSIEQGIPSQESFASRILMRSEVPPNES